MRMLSQARAPDGTLNIDVGALAPGAVFEFEDLTFVKRQGLRATCLNDGREAEFGPDQRVSPAALTLAGVQQMEMLWDVRKEIRMDPREVPAPMSIC